MLRKAIRRALFILLIAGIIVGAGLMFAQDQQTIRLRTPYAAEAPAFPAYLAAMVGADLSHGNRFEVLANGDRIFPSMIEAIEGAQKRISFETYIYDRGTIAERFTAAFEKAAGRGVQVQIIVDAVGASTMDPEHVRRLRDSGCVLLLFNPARWYTLEELNYRTHRKILVVDGAVAFTGGAALADHWAGDAQGPDNWRDTQVRITGPVVRLLEAAFYENFAEASHLVTPALDQAQTAEGQGATLLVRSSPSGGSSDMKRLYLLVVAAARRTVDITSPYFVTDESTLWTLEDAVRRGVRVRILTEGSITDATPVKYASRAVYERLLAQGVEIYEYQPTMLHTKVLVVDDVLSMFGSANFDNRSLELNDELNVVVFSAELAARFGADFAADVRASHRLELAEWRRRSLLDKSRERFWSYFAEIF